MYAWEAIQKSIDYIEENIKEELNSEKLAAISHLSLYYFQKLFNRLIGKTVNDYIKVRRVARAKTDLKESDKRIIDIALDYGFNSHETFTKAFKEVYHITPSVYRENNIVLTDFLKPDLSMNYTLIDEHVPLIVDDMIIEIRKETLNRKEYFTGFSKMIEAVEMTQIGENTLVELWDVFNDNKHLIPNIINGAVAIDYFILDSYTNKVKYFVGGESSKECIHGYDQIIIDEGDYYVCSFEADNFEYLVTDALYKANKYFFEVWLIDKGIGMEDMEPYLIQKYVDVINPKIEIWIKVK